MAELNNLNFFKTLFDIEEDTSTCFAKDAKGTTVLPILKNINNNWAEFFTINELHPYHNFKPVQEWHDENKPVRADHNVINYRNFLVEMDKISIEEQKEYVKQINLPYSTAVYSGGKSIHYIISLSVALTDRKDYERLARRLYKAIGKDIVDNANKNPSRLSRFPNAIRKEKNKVQKLLEIKERIILADLEKWIFDRIGEDKEIDYIVPKLENKVVSTTTKNFLMFGAPEGERNMSLFKASCNLAHMHTFDEIFAMVKPICDKMGLDEFEVKNTLRSAIAKVGRNEED